MLDAFIAQHKIVSAGVTIPGVSWADLIVDDPCGLITMAAGSDYYISAINWWERAPISTGSRLGMGGPRDPRASEEFFFSEIAHLGGAFDASTRREELLAYIERVKADYSESDLYPSLDIVKK